MSDNLDDQRGDIVDARFALRGRTIALDHADALLRALAGVLPWLATDAEAGVHPLAGLSPGEHEWYLSRRTCLSLRLPRHRVPDLEALVGRQLDLNGHLLVVGPMAIRELARLPVLYSRFVTFGATVGEGLPANPPDEKDFLSRCQAELSSMGLTARSLVCGKRQSAAVGASVLQGFSLMVSGLDPAGVLRLQQLGLGQERKRGCGIFVPHKSVVAVGTLE